MGSSAKIMVVDDDPDMRETLQIILEAVGHTVVTAADGEECLAKLKTECPDLLILDLLMPKMDGFAVCKELKDPRRAKYAKMPIIILTSVREDASQCHGFAEFSYAPWLHGLFSFADRYGYRSHLSGNLPGSE